MSGWGPALAGWESWCRASGHAESTIELRRGQLRRFAEEVGSDDPWGVTLGEMVAWLGRDGWAPTTRQSHRQALRSFFAWATDLEYVSVDPTTRLPRVRTPARVPRPAPDRVFESALAGASERDRLMLLLAGYAGLRRAEVAALAWQDLGGGRLRIHGKGGRVRVLPMHPDLAAALDAERRRRAAGGYGSGWRYRPAGDGGFVFPGRNGGHTTPTSIGQAARRVLGEGWSTHTLRHRFATRAYAVDRDLLAVQQLLGHASAETTRQYAQLPNGALEAAVLGAG